jgi:hypothetical protein
MLFLYRLTDRMKFFPFFFANNEGFFISFLKEDNIFQVAVRYIGPVKMQLNLNTKWSSLIKIIRKALQ